jgi:ribonuclease HII
MLSPYFLTQNLECGCDEAGRGCLAGPVTAAAVILQNNSIPLINDSKKLSEALRDSLRFVIEDNSNSYFAVTHLFQDEIDEINILNASMKAMQESVLKLDKIPNHIIIDGNRPLNSKLGMMQKTGKIFTEKEIALLQSIPTKSVIKGDSKFQSIAAASILAKTHRDAYMEKIHEEYPMYNWKQNKGYPTKEHREAIQKYGITKHHRLTFKMI